MKKNPGILNLWLWKMAWRDSRSHRKRLLLFTSAIVLGIAALVSIGSFGANLQTAVDEQAKTLLGADLLLSSRQPFSPKAEALIDSIGGQQAREIVFNSMAYFPKSNGTRLVEVRALQGDFPFYGKLGTVPKDAAKSFKSGPKALVDDALLLQFNAVPSDTIRIGGQSFEIAGRLRNLPTEPPIASTFSPRVYLPLQYLDQSSLIQKGSLVTYRVYFKFDSPRDVEKLVRDLEPTFDAQRIREDTVEERKQDVGEIMENLYRFLNLVGFIALILGSIGVASAVHVYIRQKLNDVSVLRCLGAQSGETFLIYLIQVVTMALIGSVFGALLGIFIQSFLPGVFRDFLPVQIDHFISWPAILEGILIGLVIALLFALLPLISIRKVSPLSALRSSYETTTSSRDRLRWLIYAVLTLAVTLFAISQMDNVLFGVSFTAALLLAFGILSGVAKMLTFAIRKFFPKSWPYVWRQGLANLYRPNNQTLILLLAVGLGTFLITTLYLCHNILLEKVTYVGGGDRPNLILFDIQPDQKDRLVDLIHDHDLTILQEAPIVTMRLAKVKGQNVSEILSDTTHQRGRWIYRWEFRTTYRDHWLDSEKIVAGAWQGKVEEETDVVPVSLEAEAAERMGVTVGDTVVWNVQGLPLTSVVGSLREVDWQRIQANFMAVFPEGALEQAPQIYILATRAKTAQKSAELQRAVVQSFPNVSMIDLALVLSTLDSFLNKISFAITFMAFFSIFTGLVVLTAAVITSRFQRVQESILLRTLGASRKQVVRIMIIEYVFLGGFAALTGLLLSYLSGWALAYFVFDSIFVPTLLPFVIVLLSVIGLTVLVGMSNSRGILDRPPLEVLRAEA